MMQHTQTHMIAVVITPMVTPTMAATMIITNKPPDSDWSASGPVVTLSFAENAVDLVNPEYGSVYRRYYVYTLISQYLCKL